MSIINIIINNETTTITTNNMGRNKSFYLVFYYAFSICRPILCIDKYIAIYNCHQIQHYKLF